MPPMVVVHHVDDQLVTSALRNEGAGILMRFPHPISDTKLFDLVRFKGKESTEDFKA